MQNLYPNKYNILLKYVIIKNIFYIIFTDLNIPFHNKSVIYLKIHFNIIFQLFKIRNKELNRKINFYLSFKTINEE